MQFGVIGCGTVAQIMHIPYLAELPKAALYALVDPAEDRADELADRYNVPHVYTSHDSLLEERGDELDAVIVLTPAQTHANVVVDTLAAGVHTLVEKPLAATLEDATAMVEAAETSDATAMVAYMKRYDPSYERAREQIDGLDAIDLVTAYDVDPDHFRIIDEVYDLVGGTPPADLVEESVAKRRADIEQAIGTDDNLLVDAYDFQLDHLCHDVSALRGLFGEVERIAHVDIFAGGRYASAHLVYEDGVRCVLETGNSDRKWFEEFIRVDGPDGMVKVDFSNPFIKNTPTELRVKRGIEELLDTVYTPSYDESFKRELQYFIRCVEGDAEVRTTFAEAREDLRVIIDLFRTYRGEHPRADREEP
ncbi:Gfo/Idh/MocA family protein [Halegenticoccus soli]|uniref:Gfo/Idh/MocA family protein n=1 Tax=Halegenticoccus soli TaxID=1985678 RepID=UPI000C6D58D7|nr:Gfo/Idh/MocA family oxidoreductase [Halegenticoccus soli]